MKIKVQYNGGTEKIKFARVLDMSVKDNKIIEKDKIVNVGGKELPF